MDGLPHPLGWQTMTFPELRVDRLREYLSAPLARRTPPQPLKPPLAAVAAMLDAGLEDQAGRPIIVRRDLIALDSWPGPHWANKSLRLGDLWSIGGLAGLDAQPEDLVFFDVETTGLSGGAGAYAFLYGLGWLTAGGFELAQFFLDDPSAEAGLLAAVLEALRPSRVLVSFNGKSFDLPLLRNRLGLHLFDGELAPNHPHLDLLYPARRLWARRLVSCNLGALEAAVLRVTREEDVPGWQIPELYYSYLHAGAVGPLRRVLAHNSQDLVALAGLLLVVARIAAHPGEMTWARDLTDLIGLGILWERAGHLERAGQCYELAVQIGDVATRIEALNRLAFVNKRLDDRAKAAHLWESVIGSAGEHALIAAVELAKYYEHHAIDLPRALAYTSQAVWLARKSTAGNGELSLTALERRRERLIRKRDRRIGPDEVTVE